MRIKNIILTALAASTALSAVAETSYYWRGEYGDPLFISSSWSLVQGSTADADVALDAPNENTDIIVDSKGRCYSSFARISLKNGISGTVRSWTSTNTTEIWFNGSTTSHLIVLNDFSTNISNNLTGLSDGKYKGVNATFDKEKALRLITSTQAENVLTVGGDMTLSTSKYHDSILSYNSNSTTIGLRVKGQWAFNHTGNTGFHLFNFNASGSTTTDNINLGGLASSGKTVVFTATKTNTVNLNFIDNDEGVFKGGEFSGILVNGASGVNSQFNFTMDANKATQKTQTINIYKASNTAGHGLTDEAWGIAGMTDMAIGTIEVKKGDLVFNSELSIANVNLSGGTLSLTMGDGATVGNLTATGGSWIFADTIDVETFTSSGTINVVFTEALEKEFYTLITCNGLSVDPATTFVAVDKNGNEIAGNFDVVFADNKYSLNFTAAVPEASEIAMLFGIIALGFAAYRRRK